MPLRLVATAHILSEAEAVMRAIQDIYYQPIRDFRQKTRPEDDSKTDLLRRFSEACRSDLSLKGLALSCFTGPCLPE